MICGPWDQAEPAGAPLKSDHLDQAARGHPVSLASHGYLLAQRADEPHPARRTERMHSLSLAANRATRTCAGSSCPAAGSALQEQLRALSAEHEILDICSRSSSLVCFARACIGVGRRAA